MTWVLLSLWVLGLASRSEAFVSSSGEGGGRTNLFLKHEAHLIGKEKKTTQSFLNHYVRSESGFFREAREAGIALDGIDFTAEGEVERKRLWTAASKEAIDLMLITRVFSGNEYAVRLYAEGENNKEKAVQYCLSILKEKIKSYELFQKRYPRYAGFLPWIQYKEGQWRPLDDWEDRVPALDNGEWLWAIYALLYKLPEYDQKLAQRYQNYFNKVIGNLKEVFWEPSENQIRAEAHIHIHISNEDNKSVYTYTNNIEGYYLNDLFEGILVTYLFVMNDLLSENEEESLVSNRVYEVNQSQWGTTYYLWPRQPNGDGSSHTKWGQFVVPELDNIYISLFSWRQECLRSNVNTYGTPSSCTEPLSFGGNYTPYNSLIQTPYGAMSMIYLSSLLEEGQVDIKNPGLSWLVNMYNVPGMRLEGYGVLESFSVDLETGELQDIAYLATFDVKGLTMVAIVGGVISEVRSRLKETGDYEKFMQLVQSCYQGVIDEAEVIPVWEECRNLRRHIKLPRPVISE